MLGFLGPIGWQELLILLLGGSCVLVTVAVIAFIVYMLTRSKEK